MDRPLFARVLARSALARAWEDVLANDAEDGELTKAIRSFAEDADVRLDRLADELQNGEFSPGDLLELQIPKADGGHRTLHIPTVADRIVERALLRGLNPIVDPHLGARSYGYRPGLGVVDVVQAVAMLRDEGLCWAARADVHDCFPSIDVSRVPGLLGAFVEDARLLGLVDDLLARCRIGVGGRRAFAGLPQGSPLSPLFANLVLTSLDDAVLRAGHPLVRYADDFVILTTSREAASAALLVARRALKELEMTLGDDKTEVMSFDDGFCFVGEDFGSRYPPALTDHRVQEAESGNVVYVGRQGSRVRIKAGRLLVDSTDKAILLDLPQSQIARVVCFGSIAFSAGARDWALGTDTQVVFLSRRGSYAGQLLAGGGKKRIARLRAQLGVTDDRALHLGRRVLEGKLVKQAVLLRHFIREDNADEVSRGIRMIDAMVPMLLTAASPEELMGVEGAAARSYFEALRALVPVGLGFVERNRQPPLDVVNAALSYAYAVLQGECVSALAATGLDPSIGLLHTDSRNQPGLALDLMEEFRPTIVDQVVVQLFRSGALTAAHGTTIAGKKGVLLTKAGKEALMGGYERRMLTRVKNASDFAGSWRRQLYRQAQRIAVAIAGDDDAYRGLSWR